MFKLAQNNNWNYRNVIRPSANDTQFLRVKLVDYFGSTVLSLTTTNSDFMWIPIKVILHGLAR